MSVTLPPAVAQQQLNTLNALDKSLATYRRMRAVTDARRTAALEVAKSLRDWYEQLVILNGTPMPPRVLRELAEKLEQ